LVLIVGGTWYATKTTTEYLLYESSSRTASDWATLLATSIPDIEQIANGEMPSSASMAYFDWARKTGSVDRYIIYNGAGYSQLVSGGFVSQVDISEFSAKAAAAFESANTVIDFQTREPAKGRRLFAEAYFPVFQDSKPVAAVKASVDVTEAQALYLNTLLVAGGGLCLLTTLAFSLPAIAWYRRTKEKLIADRRIRYLAQHDALTGLTNRSKLIETLDGLIVARVAEGSGLAAHFIDLDKFKEVNDSLGHDGGDFLLKAVSERLRSVSRPGDIVARLGGDEFVVVQDQVRTHEQAEQFAERLIKTLAMPLLFNGHQIQPSGSVGVAMIPDNGTNSDRILKCADLALYASKANGRNCVRFFSPDMDEQLQARLILEKLVRKATLEDGFTLHYQPIHDVRTKKLVGFEALARLPRPDGTLVEPALFIPIAEDLKLIGRVGAWILKEACQTATNWPDHLVVSVNLSPAQFEQGCVSQIVDEALRESGLAPNRLELEITEALLLRDSVLVMQELGRLKRMGVAVVMDDFGTGYSSLSYLWRFPFDKIKIDRSFINGFENSRQDAKTVIKTIIGLGRQLHMQVTVEGVETEHQVDFVDGVDADQVQGFFFSRPIPPTELGAYLKEDIKRKVSSSSLEEYKIVTERSA
jgi:diguanylate cyclase (GGDEF)-like protein